MIRIIFEALPLFTCACSHLTRAPNMDLFDTQVLTSHIHEHLTDELFISKKNALGRPVTFHPVVTKDEVLQLAVQVNRL